MAFTSTFNGTVTLASTDESMNESKGVHFANNTTSIAQSDVVDLANGFNAITVPVSTGLTVKGVILQPPPTNAIALTLKGVTGDTGIALSKLNPTVLAFETAPATIGITTGAALTGFRIYWF